MDRFIAGDPLRGFGVVLVFVFHAAAAAVILTGNLGLLTTHIGSLEGYIDAYGVLLGSLLLLAPLGFLVFFLLSGYLIGRPFVSALVEGRSLPSLYGYARNRFMRIVPAYWFTLTVIIAVFVLTMGKASLSLADAVALYGFQVSAQNPLDAWIAQAWSLTVEMKFYVLLPIATLVAIPVVRRLPSQRARMLAIALPCAAWFFAASFVYDGRFLAGEEFFYFLRMLGAGVAIAALEPLLRTVVARGRHWVGISTASFAAAVIYLVPAGALYGTGFPFDSPMANVAIDLAVLMLVLAPLMRQWADGGCWRVLDNRAAHWLGVRSYSIYLVHLATLRVLGEELADAGYGYKETFVVLMTVGAVLTLALGELLHRAVERPFMNRKRRPVAVPATTGTPPPRAVASGS